MAGAAEKLNTRFFRCPYALLRIFHGAAGRVMSVIYSYSNRRGAADAECVLTRDGLAGCAGVSTSTAARALQKLRGTEGFVQREEYGRRRYTLHIQGKCVRRYRYLFEHQFVIGGVTRRLTGVEETVLSLIASHITNPNAARGFEGSEGRFAAMTGYSTDAVGNALRALIGAGILHRPRRGTSRRRLSRYVVCRELRRVLCGEAKEAENKQDKPLQPLKKSEIDHNARTEYERHYSLLRARAIARAEAAQDRANADPAYAAAHKEIRGLEPKIAFAQVHGDETGARELIARRKSLMVQQARALARIGMTAEELVPQWHCPVCEDTGFRLSDGKMCTCWRPPKGAQP